MIDAYTLAECRAILNRQGHADWTLQPEPAIISAFDLGVYDAGGQLALYLWHGNLGRWHSMIMLNTPTGWPSGHRNPAQTLEAALEWLRKHPETQRDNQQDNRQTTPTG